MAYDAAEILVGRRYLAKGFVDDALRVFVQHAEGVAADDWTTLRDRLLERGRLTDVVDVCRIGNVPLPREEILSIGDHYLRRAEMDRAIDVYEMAGADQARWERVVDRLIERPDRVRQARSIAAKHLNPAPEKPRLVKVAT